jgi:hypothetical protein
MAHHPTHAYLCPVCRQPVKPTRGRNIPAHLDSLYEDTCPGGGHPFAITVTVILDEKAAA